MSKFASAVLASLAVLALHSEARAWGVHDGDTIGHGDNMPYAEAGWPDVSLGFQHGMFDNLDIGARLSFIYGIDGTPNTAFGIGLRAPIRYQFLRGRINVYAHADPGIKFDAFSYFPGYGALFGFQLPIGVEAGYAITHEAIVSFGVDMPFYFNVTQFGFVVIPPMLGPGFEYHPDEHIAFGLNTRFGGAIFAGLPFGLTLSDFAFVTQAYVGYRL